MFLRALKTKSNTPKYGLIFHSSFIGRAATANKGRISRYLANKCAIASRIDCFAEVPTNVFGDILKNQVEDRLKFYDSGALPPKNADIMADAVVKAEEAKNQIIKAQKKKKDKKKKNKKAVEADGAVENGIEEMTIDETAAVEPPKKKKKKKSKDGDE